MIIRLTCLVPGCTHSRGPRKGDEPAISPTTQWICGDHWIAIPKALRQERRAAVQDLMLRHGSPGRAERAWEACKSAAVEKAAGL